MQALKHQNLRLPFSPSQNHNRAIPQSLVNLTKSQATNPSMPRKPHKTRLAKSMNFLLLSQNHIQQVTQFFVKLTKSQSANLLISEKSQKPTIGKSPLFPELLKTAIAKSMNLPHSFPFQNCQNPSISPQFDASDLSMGRLPELSLDP
jgi:hypothetical protein